LFACLPGGIDLLDTGRSNRSFHIHDVEQRFAGLDPRPNRNLLGGEGAGGRNASG
jgi:hypothetical protein